MKVAINLGKSVLVFLVLLAMPMAFASTWYDTDYQYSMPITITNSTGNQVQLFIDTYTLNNAGKLESDCSDLRFVTSDNETELNYWLENCSMSNGVNSSVWLNTSGNSSVFMYYGYSSASNVSDTSGTFYTDINNIVGGWLGDECSGTLVQDYSSNGNDLTKNGNADYVPDGLYGCGLYADGQLTSFFNSSSVSNYNFENESVTFLVDVKLNNTGVGDFGHRLISCGGNAQGASDDSRKMWSIAVGESIYWTPNSNMNYYGYYYDGGGDHNPFIQTNENNWTTQEWYEVAFRRNSSTSYFFLNGSFIYNESANFVINCSASLNPQFYIGIRDDGLEYGGSLAEPMNATVDNVLIVNGIVTDEQITAKYGKRPYMTDNYANHALYYDDQTNDVFATFGAEESYSPPSTTTTSTTTTSTTTSSTTTTTYSPPSTTTTMSIDEVTEKNISIVIAILMVFMLASVAMIVKEAYVK